MNNLRPAARPPRALLDQQIIGDMCVLQPNGYSLLVAFCYRHQPTAQSQRGSPARSRSRHLRPADALLASSLPGGRVCHIVAGLPVARLACSYPRQGSGSVVWLPVLRPNSRKGVGIRPEMGRRPPGRIWKYDAFKRPGLHAGCTGGARELRPACGRGLGPGYVAGHRRGGPVQAELSQQALMPRVLRGRSQAGKLEPRRRPGTRTAAGPECRPGGAGPRRVPRGSRLRPPRGRRTRSRYPRCGTSWTGPASPRPGPPRPGRTRQDTGLPVPAHAE